MVQVSYLVVVVKVDPTSQTLNGVSPFSGVTHDNRSAFFVVLGNAELHDSSLSGDTQLLLNLVLDGETVSVPTETSFDMISLHGPITRDDVLDGRGQQVTVVRQSGREWRSIVEGVSLATLGEFNL